MKQLLLLLCLAILGTNPLEAKETPIPSVILHSFFSKFKSATDVCWSQNNGFTVASFSVDHHKKFAYYSHSNELILVAEPITADRLPSNLQEEIESMYKHYATVDVYKLDENGNTTYSAVVENEKRKIFLKSAGNYWEEVKLVKK